MKGNAVTGERIKGLTNRRAPYHPWSGLAVLVVAVAIGVAACNAPSSPHLASLRKGASNRGGSATTSTASPGTTTTTVPKGNADQLLGGWTSCMRSNGDPNQAEPTIDADGAIHVTTPAGYFGSIYGASGQISSGAGITCQLYLTEASTALNGGEPLQPPSLATMDRFAACMRANGVPGFPDPGVEQRPGSAGSGGSQANPNSPAVQKASKLCAHKVGAKGLGFGTAFRPGEIEIESANHEMQEIVTGTT
jgi:hypothetical protein